jgi:radical SAM protein with 4Fe4S-binding SPASM domain
MTGVTKYSFNNLFFEATRRCNLSCSMCMASSNNKPLVERKAKDELSTDEIERHVLRTVRDIGVETITWSGGEFVLRPDAVELVRRASDYGYSSIMATNGTQLDRRQLEELNKAADGSLVVAVGINSVDEDNRATRDADCDVALKILDLCEELGIRRNVVVTLGQHNMATLDQTLNWLEEKGIPYNRSPFTARGSGREFWDSMRFTRTDMENVIHPALRRHPLGYISYTPFFLGPEVHERFSKGARNITVPQNPSIGCWCGTWLAMSAEGDVSPCGILLDDVVYGNVRDMTFQEIIDSSPEFQKILDRNQLEGKCGRCRYKFTCGGCRAMAYYEHGNVMAEDPTCFFEPEDESTVSEHEQETNKMFKRYAFMVRYAHSKRNLVVKEVEEPGDEEIDEGSFDQKGRA